MASFSSLPKEMITKTLSLLPLKKLTQTKLVPKSWCTLLKNPKFLLNLYKDQRRIVISAAGEQRSLWLRMDSEGGVIEEQNLPVACQNIAGPCLLRICFLGSCNGLLLTTTNLYNNVFAIWNPTTGACNCIKLPQHDGALPGDGSHRYYGIGFDSSSNDYKVVKGFSRFDYSRGIYIFGAHIYSWKTNSWKTIENKPFDVEQKNGIFSNGFLHWLARYKYKWAILSLDMVEENFDTVPLPDSFGDKRGHIIDFTCLEGLLCIVLERSRNEDANGVWYIWVMKEYGVKESWTKLMEIPSLMETNYVTPLCITRSGKLILQVNRDKIVKYNPKTQGFETLFENKSYIESVVLTESPASLIRTQQQTLPRTSHVSGRRRVICLIMYIVCMVMIAVELLTRVAKESSRLLLT